MPKFECPHCSQSIDAPDELTGTDANCPTCGGAITVPEIYVAPKDLSEVEASGAPKKKLPPLSEDELAKFNQEEANRVRLAGRADVVAEIKGKRDELKRRKAEDWEKLRSYLLIIPLSLIITVWFTNFTLPEYHSLQFTLCYGAILFAAITPLVFCARRILRDLLKGDKETIENVGAGIGAVIFISVAGWIFVTWTNNQEEKAKKQSAENREWNKRYDLRKAIWQGREILNVEVVNSRKEALPASHSGGFIRRRESPNYKYIPKHYKVEYTTGSGPTRTETLDYDPSSYAR